ncbi:MAG: hypothetical protein M1564_00595 [Candidatus Marsarchaeota archaeon]|jgi:hypothetical protein|nr:hypothetical protein [Candidatus Marsarchaeota archaeon]MCL5430785.1 hypothetical protein [Candidatus Marsarchaeota archaeon]
MIFISDFIKAVRISLYDEDSISHGLSAKKAFGFYYKSTVVPIIVSAAILLLFGSSIAQYSSSGIGGFPGSQLGVTSAPFSAAYELAFDILTMLVLIPAMILFEAFFYHVVGYGLMRRFKGGFSNTASAVVYSFMPLVALSWSFEIPVVGTLAKLIGIFWGFVILVAALAKLHGTSVESVVMSMVIMSFVAGFIIVLLAVPVLLSLSSGLAHIPISGLPSTESAYPSSLSSTEAAAYSWIPIPYSALPGGSALGLT